MTAGEFTSCPKCGRAIVASNHRCHVRPSMSIEATVAVASSTGFRARGVFLEMSSDRVTDQVGDIIAGALSGQFSSGPVATIAPPRTIKPKGSLTPTQSVIMDAARTFDGSFTREDLAVRFERRPTMFALRGYPHLLNSSSIWCRINGQGGLIYRGFIAQHGDQLRVTRTGAAK